MPQNKLTDVRNHLIAAMEELMDESTQITAERMERLKQTNELGKTLVESAKAEASYVSAMAKMARSSSKTKLSNEFLQIENKPNELD